MKNALAAGQEIITALGNRAYPYVSSDGVPPVPVTPFTPSDFYDEETLNSVVSGSSRVMKHNGITSLEHLFEISQKCPRKAGEIHRACLEQQAKDLTDYSRN
jgi:hypothetical protein